MTLNVLPQRDHNAVRGTGGKWVYGLRIRHEDGSLTVSASRRDGGRSFTIEIEGLSPYRTTTLARYMGDKRPGYQTAILAAIKERFG